METKINENDSIEIVFADGEKTATASISYKKLKELLLEDAYETITTPNCGCSSCAENNFCECNPINEDMEFAGMFLSVGKSVFISPKDGMPKPSEKNKNFSEKLMLLVGKRKYKGVFSFHSNQFYKDGFYTENYIFSIDKINGWRLL